MHRVGYLKSCNNFNMESSWYVTKMYSSSKTIWMAFFFRDPWSQYQGQRSKDLDRNQLCIELETASAPPTTSFEYNENLKNRLKKKDMFR